MRIVRMMMIVRMRVMMWPCCYCCPERKKHTDRCVCLK